MPFCPRCRTEYREGCEHCADCGTALVATLPPLSANRHDEPTREVRIATFSTWSEASMWAERLEAEGIPSVLVPLGPGAGGWGSSSFLPHELKVRAEDVERAQRLIQDEHR
jgi:hypothetical protein